MVILNNKYFINCIANPYQKGVFKSHFLLNSSMKYQISVISVLLLIWLLMILKQLSIGICVIYIIILFLFTKYSGTYMIVVTVDIHISLYSI